MNKSAETIMTDKPVVDQHLQGGHEHKDPVGAKIGMWLFLMTELLLFGGMFLIYGTYRYMNSDGFHSAAQELNTIIGTFNTVILLTSSLTVALSITALQKGNKTLSLLLLAITIAFAFWFLVNKYFEWSHEIHKGIYPGSSELTNRSNGEILFFGLYYVMTGVHGIHVILGIVILSFMLAFIVKNKITPEDSIKLEVSGLYWHLVDIIWIFLFPLFYLLR
ncbi:MAG: cytochrome c oxidase subunit 3 family protein [Clostridiales bacterium]